MGLVMTLVSGKLMIFYGPSRPKEYPDHEPSNYEVKIFLTSCRYERATVISLENPCRLLRFESHVLFYFLFTRQTIRILLQFEDTICFSSFTVSIISEHYFFLPEVNLV